jgi:hypothetical protein
MSSEIEAFASKTEPRLFFRTITGIYNPSPDDKEKLQSTSFLKALDLICEGPIEGFCDATGKSVNGIDILQGIYLNEVPIKQTNDLDPLGQYNFRNVQVAYKKGMENQAPFYTGQGGSLDGNVNNFYWLEDFSYASQTIPKNINLDNQTVVEEHGDGGGKKLLSQGAHSVVDVDVDWLGITIGVSQCYSIDPQGEHQTNGGAFHIWGDITGFVHRSLPVGETGVIVDDGVNEHNLFVNVSGLALSKYREDVFLKLKDIKDIGKTRPRNVFIRNVTQESFSFKSKFAGQLESVTEIVYENLRYPSSALIASMVSAENFGSPPQRSFDLKLKKVKVPTNYIEKMIGPDGPTKKRAYSSSYGAAGSEYSTAERHEGVWDGNFKEELEWTDNPAWILYDLITNDRYGLGEYIQDIAIDKWELFKIAKYCDELVSTSMAGSGGADFIQERRFSCNILLTNAADAYQTINEIASIFRGITYFNNLEIFVSINSLKDPVLSFSNDNVQDGSFRYTGTPKHTKFTAVKVAYKDKDDSFLPKYEYVEDPEGIIRYGIILKESSAVGCTSRDQALRLARWILLTSNLEEETVNFITDTQAEYLEPGQVFSIYDENRSGFRVGGRVIYVQGSKSNVSENFILLDQNLNTGDYNYNGISFLIPGEDFDTNDPQYKEFIHRNGYNVGAQDNGDRSWSQIPLDSATSNNPTLNNYIENTSSGAKILTDEDEDLLIKVPLQDSFISAPAKNKTFNDYILESGVLKTLRNGVDRSQNRQKIREGAIYLLHGEAVSGPTDEFEKKDFQLLSKSDNGDGTHSLVGLEYDSGKFAQVDDLSTIYTETTFDYDLDDTNLPGGPGGEPPGLVVGPPGVPQITNYGYPKENTVDLIVRTSGVINSQGESISKVFYYFHNTMENARYYQNGLSVGDRYQIRVQQITEDEYGDVLGAQLNARNVLQEGQYIVAGLQNCGDYNVLYDNAHSDLDRRFTTSGKALVAGAQNVALSIPNYNEASFNSFLKVERPRNTSEFGDVSLEGCTVFGTTYSNVVTGDVLSGEFELPDPDAYYELRWNEANSLGESPEKIMFFKGAKDIIPPAIPTDFRISMNNIFPNLVNYNWKHQAYVDSDLAGFRIYTGHVGGLNTDMEFTDFSSEKNEFNTYNDPVPGSSFAEIMGPNARYYTYEADTTDGTIRNDIGEQISFNETGAFHIRAFDFSQNLSDPANSNALSLFGFADAPDLILSGEIREEGQGTDTYGAYPILHAFYSGNFHTFKAFKKYLLTVNDETNGFGIPQNFSITKDEIKAAPAIYNAGGSGHLEIRSVVPESTYYGTLRAYTNDGRHSPEGTDRATIGKDDFAPGRLQNFLVRKQWSNFKFSWDKPPEYDIAKVLLFTGSGHQNFGIDPILENTINKLEQPANQAPVFEMFGAVDPMDTPIYGIDKFRDPGKESWEKTKFPFHAVPVDTSSNTGMYSNFTYRYLNLTGPEVHTSGTLAEDGRSMVHVFYSGIAQNDESFKSYETEYQDTSQFEIRNFNHPVKAEYDAGAIGLGSGHFAFEAVGGHYYDVRTRALFDSFESDWSTDTILTNAYYGVGGQDVYAPPDMLPPGACTWIASQKNGNNIFLSWSNPPDQDLSHINLYTGYQNFTGKKEQVGTAIHQKSLATSDVIPLKDFAKNANSDLYFWLRAVDTSNNTGDWSVGNTQFDILPHNSGQRTSIGIPEPLHRKHIIINSGINLDEDGDGAATAFIEYQITGKLDYQQSYYKVDLARKSTYNPQVGTQTSEIEHGVSTNSMTGSGIFNGLLCNKEYYLRARVHEHDGRHSDYTDAWDNPILTPRDQGKPTEMDNFYITSGPKQVFLEWDWSNGISRDISHIYVYRTGIPTGRLNEESSKEKYCWKMSDISGYFKDNPDEYYYRLSASTSYTDNEIETGILSGQGVDADPGTIKQDPYYFYFLQPEDRSQNRSKNFVSGVSRDKHNYYYTNKAKTEVSNYVNSLYGTVPHNQGYVTGGGVSADYISNVYAGNIITDNIYATDFILSHPSGRILSDNVYARGSNNHEYDYLRGSGIYMDHKMFRIGDPEPGMPGLFWTGEKNYFGNYKQPSFDKDGDGFHAIDIVPNTLEIRGNLTAGTIRIGAGDEAALDVDNQGNLTIGNQKKNITGFFDGTKGYSGLLRDDLGESDPHSTVSPDIGDAGKMFVQLDLDEYTAAELSDLAGGGMFLETHWTRGDGYRGIENRQIESIKLTSPGNYALGFGVARLGIPFAANVGYDLTTLKGNTYGLKGVTTTGTKQTITDLSSPYYSSPKYRDWFRIHNAKFKVLNDGTLFAADAQIMGTLKAAALEVNQTIVLGDVDNTHNTIIQSYGFVDNLPCNTAPATAASGWMIRGDGHAVFKSIDIRSGLISGSVGLEIGKCDSDDKFRAGPKGDISIGDSIVHHQNNFYVSRHGDLRAKNAVISGDLQVTGTIDVGEGIRLCTTVVRDLAGNVTYTEPQKGILIDSDSLRSSNFESTAFTFPTDIQGRGNGGFQITNQGRSVFHDVFITGGFLSGTSLIMGAGTQANPFFKVFNNGEMSIGSYDKASTQPKNSDPFYVSNKGDLYAQNAYIKGTITGQYGKIGSLYLNPNYLATYDADTDGANSRSSNDWQPGKTGLYLGKNGEFSIANDEGLIINWAGGRNDYITVTGIASSNTSDAIYYRSLNSNGQGQGFHLQGAGGGSWISNFDTDPYSASGIAADVQTAINGDIKNPEAGETYYVITNSEVGYNIHGIYMETDLGNCTVQWYKNQEATSVAGAQMVNVGPGSSNDGKHQSFIGLGTNNINPNGTDNYLICKPSVVGGTTTSLRFRVDLQRDNSFADNH